MRLKAPCISQDFTTKDVYGQPVRMSDFTAVGSCSVPFATQPVRLIADPELQRYSHYGVETSPQALGKTLLLRLPRILAGLLTGGRPDRHNVHRQRVPADFLIDENGRVIDVWYGRDAADHIPLRWVEAFVRGDNRLGSNTA